MCERNIELYWTACCSVTYLAGGETVILDGWCPLGRDAHFHIAERLPGRMQQDIAAETRDRFTQHAKGTGGLSELSMYNGQVHTRAGGDAAV